MERDLKSFRDLRGGMLLRRRASPLLYRVSAIFKDRATAVATADITTLEEWVIVEPDEPAPDAPYPSQLACGSPTEGTLSIIRNWPHGDISGLMEFVFKVWKNVERCHVLQPADQADYKRYVLVTSGWSGNEELIGAMQENHAFWGRYWEASERGGRYTFGGVA